MVTSKQLIVKGELLLKDSGNAGIADSYFEESLRIARAQSAKGVELRTATSIALSSLAKGLPDEAREVLEPIYEWFDEGISIPDLIDAASTLESCGANG